MTDLQPTGQEDAEELALQTLQHYLESCRVVGVASPTNHLIKMISVAATAIALIEGSDQAARRLDGTARFILNQMPKEPMEFQ